MPAERQVAPTMNADPTPMNAICEMISFGRNGGRNAHATASTAKRIIRPKSSKAACTLRIGVAFSHGGGGAPISWVRGHRRKRRYTARPMIKVGGEVDAFCTKCELTLAHTVHAVVSGKPVKVECNTCHGVHRYRDANGRVTSARPPKSERPSRAPRGRAVRDAARLKERRGRPLLLGEAHLRDGRRARPPDLRARVRLGGPRGGQDRGHLPLRREGARARPPLSGEARRARRALGPRPAFRYGARRR